LTAANPEESPRACCACPALPRAGARRAINPGLSRAELTCLVRAVAADTARWQSRLRLPGCDDRWWALLATSNDVDVWLLSWLPGQATDLHDHGSSAASFTVVRGQLSEIRVDPDGRATSYRRRPDSVTWLAPGVIHDVGGAGDEPAVSIHAYSPPLREMTYYARDAHDQLRVARTIGTHQPEPELAP
jgi:quercetin dioxygenase-like cupin family protein